MKRRRGHLPVTGHHCKTTVPLFTILYQYYSINIIFKMDFAVDKLLLSTLNVFCFFLRINEFCLILIFSKPEDFFFFFLIYGVFLHMCNRECLPRV